MALYAIGDLHLSLTVNKPMDIFGSGWSDHVRRLEEAFSNLNNDDVIVLCGKGHETYQEINHVKYHMDEREIVADYLKAGN